MKIKIIYFSLFFVAISFSCKKESMVIPENTTVPLISKVNTSDQPQYEYTYNFANMVSEEKSKFNFTNFTYNDQNQLMAVNYYSDEALLSKDMKILDNTLSQKGLISFINSVLGGTVKYEYNSAGQLTKTTVSQPQNNSTEYSEFRYDNDKIGRQTLFWDNKITGYIDYFYDARGNLIKETLYSIPSSGLAELSTTTQYEFDNKQNPFRSFYRLLTPGINTNPNNIIKEILTIHFKPGEGTDIVQVTLTSYTYNSIGYPVRKNGTVDYLYK